MNENLKKALETIHNDPELKAKFKAAPTMEEAYAIATTVKAGYTIEEFTEVMDKLRDVIKQNADGELTSEDVDEAAGGGDTITTLTTTTTVTLSASAAV